MARGSASPPVGAPKTVQELRAGLRRLQEAQVALEAFDISNAHPDDDGALQQLRAEISSAVDRAFPENSPDHSRYSSAALIHGFHSVQMGAVFGRGPTGPNLPEYRRGLTSDIASSRGLIATAISTIERDLRDLEQAASTPSTAASAHARDRNNKVFIVHGRADGPKNTVARFLGDLGLIPIILHEQPSKSRSTIEKIEAFDDVDFAVVIFTPDDVGALEGEKPVARPRQNVLFELGYFIGRLKRSSVCVLRLGEMEMLSDYVGPIWVDFDAPGAWKQTLARELRAAGFVLDPGKLVAALGL